MNESRSVEVCIAGGGPAGMVLGYLLGRCGISTLVLESGGDFDRDFRGDTLHAGVLEIFQSIGLAGEILELPHHKIRSLSAGGTTLVNFEILDTDFPFVTMMAQSIFLSFLAEKSREFPSYKIEMDASVRELVQNEAGAVKGVRYRKNGEMVEVAAGLVVACDGRGSHLRKEAGLELEPVTDLLEVLWFRLPRDERDQQYGRSGAIIGGRLPFIVLERTDHYQIACVIKPGTFSEIRKEGICAFHEEIGRAAPELESRAVETLKTWKDIAFLHVEGGRLAKWHGPGLLLIGDAAHAMTPVGGVGINYAIWDAVETANVIVPVLKNGEKIDENSLGEIQRRREPATRRMQTIQRVAGRKLLEIVSSDLGQPFQIPRILRWILTFPGIRSIPPKLIALGGKRTKCEVKSYFQKG